MHLLTVMILALHPLLLIALKCHQSIPAIATNRTEKAANATANEVIKILENEDLFSLFHSFQKLYPPSSMYSTYVLTTYAWLL